jgi:hypothetical protein
VSIDHQEALRRESVEKYLLGELSPAEREEFEEHFFDCQECAADLKSAVAFLDEAKKELKRMPPTKPAQRVRNPLRFGLIWRPAFLASACAVLLSVIIYQNLLVHPRLAGKSAQLDRPEVLSAISLIGANSRGAAIPSAIVSKGQPILLTLDIPAAQSYASYSCVLIDPSGAIVWSVPVSAEQAKDTVSIRVPPGDWRRGEYTLVVKGYTNPSRGEAVDLARYRLELSGTD